MKYLSRLLFVAVAAFGLAACNDGADFIGPNGEQPGDMKVNVAFSLADKAVLTRSKVSGTENRVHTLQMVCFDANGLYLGIRKAEIEPEAGPTPDTGKIKGTVPQGTSRIHFIANRNLSIPLSFNVGTSEETVMQSMELSTIWNDADHQEICYWGYHKEASAEDMNNWLNPTTTESRVYMIRDRARVVLTYDPTGATIPVTKIEWLIHGGRERGYLAPKSSDWESYYGNSTVEGHESELISVAHMNEYSAAGRYSLWTSESDNDDNNFDVAYQSTGSYEPKAQYLFDDNNTDADPLKAILKVTYTVDGSPKTVYHVLKLNDDDRVKYDVVRNNTYYINCKLLSPDVAYYETLKEAIDGEEFVNADVEIDRSIPDINNDEYTLQIKLPTETTSIVLNTEGNHDLDFVFRKVSDVNETGSTNPEDFDVYWEKAQTFCTNPTVSYVEATKQFMIHTTVIEGKLTNQLQDEWIVVEHKASGLKRFIHVFVIDQFRYRIQPTLKRVGTSDNYVLHFKIPPMEHTKFITDEGGNKIPDPEELIYPESLYPIDVKFTTNTLNAYNITETGTNYGLFGVSVESTSGLFSVDSFESGYNNPTSTENTAYNTHWYYQQTNNHWDFWYTYSLKTCPPDNTPDQEAGGDVYIYFKDVRDHIKYATVADVGLFLYVEYFGKNYSVPVTN